MLSTLRLETAGSFRDQLADALRAPHRPSIVVLSGNQVGSRITVDRSLLIGRDPAADVCLTDAGVSWHHARIEDRGDQWVLVDLKSTNGTRVNGRAGVEFVLSPGDKIIVARTILRFEVLDQADQQYDELVQRLLTVDDLSGLLVRRKFDQDLAQAIEAARLSSQRVGLLVMDLDGIKSINDTHGHLFGAYTIGEAGKQIGQVIAGRGFGCRFGGDEFLAALPGLDVTATAAVGAEILAAINAHHFEREGVVLRPGISIGVASFPESAPTAQELFQRGDEALYRAKQTGKNRVCL